MTKVMEKKMSFNLAYQFNVLEFLCGDEGMSELELSRMIARLLDPNGRHGTGDVLLRSMLEVIGVGKEGINTMDVERASVLTEYTIWGRDRLDIFVSIPGRGNEKPFCIAIENKPYAKDGENQIQNYLSWLKEGFEDRFRLIYLSGNGEGPAEHALPKEELTNWSNRFQIMSYDSVDNGNDQFQEFRTGCSFTEWIAKCRQRCEAEKIRFFLVDIQSFFEREFGDKAMSNGRSDGMREWLLSNPDSLETARLVHQAWPKIRDKVCEDFFNRLCEEVKRKLAELEEHDFGAIHVECSYEYKDSGTQLFIFRTGWPQSKGLRTRVGLEGMEKGITRFILGVTKKSVDDDKESIEKFKAYLRKSLHDLCNKPKVSSWWPWYWHDPKIGHNLETMIHTLYKENQLDKYCPDTVTGQFAEAISQFAQQVIPCIDKWYEKNPQVEP